MKRTRSILAIIATTAAVGTLAFTGPASADTTDTARAASSANSVDYWGSYYSANFKAKANGTVKVDWDEEDESNSVRVKGKLYDLDHRTYSRGGKCAYIRFQTHGLGDDGAWTNRKVYKHCGAGSAKSFTFWNYDVDAVRAKVCQIGLHSATPIKCGSWKYLYSADDE
ncbi:hypothetical protein SAMN05421505_1239 [Sinosporangium album]|uniref:Secreted protein n=1 Tax=Sinosporangium album TaxID=504805 RepID=A0A1G8FBH8_9ACTN|nr:hypothetical protein [Sinosporangium album]SDH79487.1 hypothetical protein SAMN05421505_1239 [Sinosporangium album]